MFRFMFNHLVGRNADFANWYEILGVPQTATAADVRRAFLVLSKERHPDKGGSKEAFQRLQEAYVVLSDESKRRNFDAQLEYMQKRERNDASRAAREAFENTKRAKEVAEMERVQAEQAKRSAELKEFNASLKTTPRPQSARRVPAYFVAHGSPLYHTRQVCPGLNKTPQVMAVPQTSLTPQARPCPVCASVRPSSARPQSAKSKSQRRTEEIQKARLGFF